MQEGVGPLSALAGVRADRLEDPTRFTNPRAVGAYAGLVAGKDRSGDNRPSAAHLPARQRALEEEAAPGGMRSLHPRAIRAEECDLRGHGQKIAQRGGGKKNARKRAIVALASKLAVLLERLLWVSGEVYDPLYNTRGAGGERLA